jgi:predicted MFS family arabinose efflux permease
MLNLSFFRKPRFSVASMGIGIASFSLFGAIFGTTQFLQDAHGYSALEVGAAMVPIAVGMMMGAGSSTKLVPRLGTTRIVTAGLLGMGGVLTTTLLWSYDMPYWPIGLWFLGAAVSMGWVMAPSTESVMGSVPEEKAGVASAMNDVTRQVGGALGTAVIGSLITSFYGSRIGDDVASLPEPARSAAKESIGQRTRSPPTCPTRRARASPTPPPRRSPRRSG